jgi:hypothetical protein
MKRRVPGSRPDSPGPHYGLQNAKPGGWNFLPYSNAVYAQTPIRSAHGVFSRDSNPKVLD